MGNQGQPNRSMDMDALAEECYLAEKSDTWFPDYAYCTGCKGFIFAPAADTLDMGMCPCAVLDEIIAEDEEDDEPHVCQTALTLSDALGIEPASKYTTNTNDAKLAKRLHSTQPTQTPKHHAAQTWLLKQMSLFLPKN